MEGVRNGEGRREKSRSLYSVTAGVVCSAPAKTLPSGERGWGGGGRGGKMARRAQMA